MSPCYLVTGAEPLIVQECADAIRLAARAQGCVDRERIDSSDKAGWQNLLQSASAMSLFSDRKLIEVQVESGKPGTEGSKAIQEYLSMESDDILLIVAGKITVDGQVVRLLGTKVDPAKCQISINGKLIRAKAKRFLALN